MLDRTKESANGADPPSMVTLWIEDRKSFQSNAAGVNRPTSEPRRCRTEPDETGTGYDQDDRCPSHFRSRVYKEFDCHGLCHRTSSWFTVTASQYMLLFRQSDGEVRQGLEEPAEFSIAWRGMQSSEKFFPQHFAGKQAAAARVRGMTVRMVPETRSAVDQFGFAGPQ